MEKIERALELARIPEPIYCNVCNEKLYSPINKLSIGLYGKCTVHLEDDSHEERNLLKIIEAL